MSAPDLFAFAVSASTLAGRQMAHTPAKAKRGKCVTFTVYDAGNIRSIAPAGRRGWALGELIAAGAAGITSMENPAPRLAAYIHKLRHVYNLAIETVDEPHDGEFSGTHARYILRSHVAFTYPADASRHGGDQ